MTITLSDELRARLISQLSPEDRQTLKALIDVWTTNEDTSGYDEQLKRHDEESRAIDGLSIREQEILALFRRLSEDTRRAFMEVIAVVFPPKTP